MACCGRSAFQCFQVFLHAVGDTSAFASFLDRFVAGPRIKFVRLDQCERVLGLLRRCFYERAPLRTHAKADHRSNELFRMSEAESRRAFQKR